VAQDLEVVFHRELFFCLFDKLQFVLEEVAVIDDLPALGADDVVMVILFILGFELVSALSVPESELIDESLADKQVQCPVNGCQTDSGIYSVERRVDFFGTHVFGSPLEEVHDGSSRRGPAGEVIPVSSSKSVRALHCGLFY